MSILYLLAHLGVTSVVTHVLGQRIQAAIRRAAVQSVLGALALLPISFVPALYLPVTVAGYYLTVAFVLGLVQLIFAVRFLLHLNNHTARGLLRATLVYLPALLILLVVSTLVP